MTRRDEDDRSSATVDRTCARAQREADERAKEDEALAEPLANADKHT